MNRFASVEQDGVKVVIKLERNPMPAGQWTRVTSTVRNVGKDDLIWFHDGCETLVGVHGEMTDVTWRPGWPQVGVAKSFKDRALGLLFTDDPPVHPWVSFVPEAFVNSSFVCADIGLHDVIRPGRQLTQTHVWGGLSWSRWGPPPTGPVVLKGTFAYYWRGDADRERTIGDMNTIELELPSFVVAGADDTWLSPPEIVDAALIDPAFVAYLETQDLGNGREEILWYRPQLGVWEVGILVWDHNPEPTMHLVHVHPHTGAILATVDRVWDEELDGFP